MKIVRLELWSSVQQNFDYFVKKSIQFKNLNYQVKFKYIIYIII